MVPNEVLGIAINEPDLDRRVGGGEVRLASHPRLSSGTHILRACTGRLTKRTSRATLDEALATSQLAEEQRRDRELSWSPYLVSVFYSERPNAMTFRNVGREPALRCFYYEMRSVGHGELALREGTGTVER